jgi:DNA polymerase-3 subunit chi
MGRQKVEFINLSQANSDALSAAARLAAYHQDQGRRVLIAAMDQAEAEKMDQRLWTFEQGSFVPHAVAGAEDQDREPVLIAIKPGNPNNADVLIFLHPPAAAISQDFSLAILLIPREECPELKACRDLYAKLRDAGQVEVAHITSLP